MNGGWNRNWRNDSRYDWRRYRDVHRSTFHLGLYVDPFGYGYQTFGIGYRLPPVYFSQQYWIDPAMYQLPYPPPGTQWVRYWNDALLIDMYTGQVVDVIQGFFW
jgi:Ni/Co efflux regulator RcnB